MKFAVLTAAVLFGLLALIPTSSPAGDYTFQVQNQSGKQLKVTIQGQNAQASAQQECTVQSGSLGLLQLGLSKSLIPMAKMPYTFTLNICSESSGQCVDAYFTSIEVNDFYIGYQIQFQLPPDFEGAIDGMSQPIIRCESNGELGTCFIEVQPAQ